MNNKKILIVDDDPEVRLALQIRLKANSYDIAVAVDGVSAIAEARRVVPDLVLLDLGLPAADGLTVLDRMRAIPAIASIPVIVISGSDRHSNYARVELAGANLFLQKPVQNAELLAAIARLLKGAPPQSQAIDDTNHCNLQMV